MTDWRLLWIDCPTCDGQMSLAARRCRNCDYNSRRTPLRVFHCTTCGKVKRTAAPECRSCAQLRLGRLRMAARAVQFDFQHD